MVRKRRHLDTPAAVGYPDVSRRRARCLPINAHTDSGYKALVHAQPEDQEQRPESLRSYGPFGTFFTPIILGRAGRPTFRVFETWDFTTACVLRFWFCFPAKTKSPGSHPGLGNCQLVRYPSTTSLYQRRQVEKPCGGRRTRTVMADHWTVAENSFTRARGEFPDTGLLLDRR